MSESQRSALRSLRKRRRNVKRSAATASRLHGHTAPPICHCSGKMQFNSSKLYKKLGVGHFQTKPWGSNQPWPSWPPSKRPMRGDSSVQLSQVLGPLEERSFFKPKKPLAPAYPKWGWLGCTNHLRY